RARLQHPLGVAVLGDTVYVADTYNNKVRALSLKDRKVTSVTRDKKSLAEPSGLAVVNGQLLVADTNHHRLVRLDPATGALTPFELHGVTAPAVRGMSERKPAPGSVPPRVRLGSGQPGVGAHDLTLTVQLPEGYAFTDGAPTRVRVDLTAAQGVTVRGEPNVQRSGRSLQVTAALQLSAEASGEVAFEASLYYCGEDKALCLVDRRRLTYGLATPGEPMPREITVRYTPPRPTK
ncbi:MAG TPA: hypothetical protein VK447_21635, partial [Myxococcaceae bacterium]|nr:hypothetical protein [Myxococcaceae bacterium]